jgi:hypothetical protein
MKDWIMIYANSNLSIAAMMVGILNEKQVPAKLLNRKDSAYVFLGEAEVYVPAEFENMAKEILNSTELDILDV